MFVRKKYLNFEVLDFACHPCAGAMLIFSVFFQFSCDAELFNLIQPLY